MGYGKKIKDWFTEDVEDDEEGYEPATSDTEPRTVFSNRHILKKQAKQLMRLMPIKMVI